MLNLFVFILLVYCNTNTYTSEVEVISSGMMKLRQKDMVVLFFLTVRHNGEHPLRAMVTMVECCEKITEEDTDCDLMDLYGGDFGVIQPGSIKNFTMIYPNLYGYNRRGSCLVNILHRSLANSENGEINHKIDFDTRTSTEAVPPVLLGWYKPDSFVNCETPDLDPFDHCNPVNCHAKYSGYRNFYNRKWKMCQRVPTCLADPDKELPDVAYMPNSNTCRNLEKSLTKEDIDLLAQGKIGVKTSEPQMVNIRCHHGEIDPRTGLCVCDRGWKSEPFDEDSYNLPNNGIYSMCTIKCSVSDDYKFLPSLVGLLLAIWVAICVVCCETFGRLVPVKGGDGPQTATYYPVRDGNAGYTIAPVLTSKVSFGELKQSYVSHVNTALCHSEKNFINSKSFRGSRRGLSFSSGESN